MRSIYGTHTQTVPKNKRSTATAVRYNIFYRLYWVPVLMMVDSGCNNNDEKMMMMMKFDGKYHSSIWFDAWFDFQCMCVKSPENDWSLNKTESKITIENKRGEEVFSLNRSAIVANFSCSVISFHYYFSVCSQFGW